MLLANIGQETQEISPAKNSEKCLPGHIKQMSRRGGLPQSEKLYLLSMSFEGRDCDMPVGVAAPRRDLQSRRASYCLPATDVLNFTRPVGSYRLGEAEHGIFLPERGFRCRSKGEKFEEYTNPVLVRADGHRQ